MDELVRKEGNEETSKTRACVCVEFVPAELSERVSEMRGCFFILCFFVFFMLVLLWFCGFGRSVWSVWSPYRS